MSDDLMRAAFLVYKTGAIKRYRDEVGIINICNYSVSAISINTDFLKIDNRIIYSMIATGV
jgi:hypothetical protein